MTQAAEATSAPQVGAVARGRALAILEQRDLVLFAVASLAAWAHTIDEIRIGEYIAVPFGAANIAAVAVWSRMRSGWRALASIAFGLFWAIAVIPYHVAPLLAGAVNGQHVSGLSRLVGGAAMVALGIAILRRRRSVDE